ncbi:MSHA biogenesis protein MshF [Vibrio renipiscarius]|uniref:MSHA biogenesis protein MshF n=1 Tax=Vibrio renipiscarius TaxID=1461322 RepID=UPI003550986B
MPLKASLWLNLERSRMAVWFLVLLMLLTAFGVAWKKVDQEASNAALLLASKRILERTNYYKQEWLLADKPRTLTIDGRDLYFSASGWVLPQNSLGKFDCHYWLDVFYEEARVLDAYPNKIINNSTESYFQCHYFYGSKAGVEVELNRNKFDVSVIFSS